MNLLVDELPESVWIDGCEYPIHSDFRYSILYELLLLDPEVSQEDKIWGTLQLFYPEIPGNLEEAAEAILWFYQGGKELSCGLVGSGRGNGKRIYSFEHDDGYIYAAFLEQYGIDLNTVSLHWWKFRALFHALREECQLRKIMGYRAMDLGKLDGKDQEYYRQMQEMYQIPLPQSEQEKLDAIEEALLGSGDLTGLL